MFRDTLPVCVKCFFFRFSHDVPFLSFRFQLKYYLLKDECLDPSLYLFFLPMHHLLIILFIHGHRNKHYFIFTCLFIAHTESMIYGRINFYLDCSCILAKHCTWHHIKPIIYIGMKNILID